MKTEFTNCKLANTVQIDVGFPFKSELFTDNNEDIPLVKCENLQQGYIDWDAAKHWSREDASHLKKYELQANDIVIAMDRPWVEAGLKWAFIRQDDPLALLVQRVARLRACPSLDQVFLRYVIGGRHFSEYLRSIVTGVNVPHISGRQIGNFEFNLPPLSVQRKIAAVLSAYDDLIENNTRRIALLEKMVEEVYREWFVRLRFPGHESVPVHHGVPEGWLVKPVKELLKYHIGGGWGNDDPTAEYAECAYVIRGTDIPNARQGDVSTCPLRYHTTSNFKSRKLQSGDIVFEVSGGSKGQPVGRSLFISKNFVQSFDQDIICASFCKLLRPDNNVIDPTLLYVILDAAYHGGALDPFQVQSTGITNFKFEAFLNGGNFLIPPMELQQGFKKIALSCLTEVSILGQQNATLKVTRDALLSRLLSGKLDVEHVDIAFPPGMMASE